MRFTLDLTPITGEEDVSLDLESEVIREYSRALARRVDDDILNGGVFSGVFANGGYAPSLPAPSEEPPRAVVEVRQPRPASVNINIVNDVAASVSQFSEALRSFAVYVIKHVRKEIAEVAQGRVTMLHSVNPEDTQKVYGDFIQKLLGQGGSNDERNTTGD